MIDRTNVIRHHQVMQDNAAVYRTQETLFEGKGLIDETVKSFTDVKVSGCVDHHHFLSNSNETFFDGCLDCNDEVSNQFLITIIIHFFFVFRLFDFDVRCSFVTYSSLIQTTDRSLIWNTDLVETLELRNLLGNASATMHAAEVKIVYSQIHPIDRLIDRSIDRHIIHNIINY